MVELREIARRFVSDRFGVSEVYFAAAWDSLVGINPGPRRSKRLIYPPSLAIAGEEENEPITAIMVFADASKEAGQTPNAETLLAVIREAAAKHRATEQLLNEILHVVRGLKEDRREEAPCIRVWSNLPSLRAAGAEIDKSEFDNICAERRCDVQLFVIDRGQRGARKIGEVFVNGVPLRGHQAVENSRNIKFTSAGYRWLIHLLKNNGDSGTSLDVAKAVWGYDGVFVENMQVAWTAHESDKTKNRNPFKHLDGRIRTEKSYLRPLLRSLLDINFTVDRASYVSRHILDRIPTYWLAEHQNSK